MADHDEGPRGMDSLNLGDRSIANQGNIRVDNRTSNMHYYNSPTASPAPSQPCVYIGLPRDPNRVKRSGLLEKLKQMLPDGEKHEPVALWGLAGSGKSRLALHYAKERFSQRGCSVFWIHANNETAFINDFKRIARGSKGVVDMSLDEKSLLMAVKDWIESQPTWVLVIDGANDVEFFTRTGTGTFQPLEFIPDSEGYNGTTIWTSQDRGILRLNDLGWTRGLKVGCMTTDEAVSLLQNMANHGGIFSNPEAASKLVQELDCNPLAISHVANSMQDQSIPPEEMLSHLADSRRADILGSPWTNPNRPEDEKHNILSVLSYQATHLAFRDTAAHRIIAMVATLEDHHAILQDMFFEVDLHQEKELVRRTITRLRDLSILHQDLAADGGPKYKIDRLVQEAIRVGLSQRTPPPDGSSHLSTETTSQNQEAPKPKFITPVKQRLALLRIAQNHQNQAAPDSGIHPRRKSVNELLMRFPVKIHYETLSICKPLVEEAFDVFTASQWMPPEHSTLSESADLLTRVGYYLDFCGRWLEMEIPYQKALDFRQALWGEKHLQTLAAMDSLAGAFEKLGYHQKALDLFSNAQGIRISQPHFPKTHRKMMIGNTNIAVAYHRLGRFQQAEQLLVDTFLLQQKALGEEHLDTARTMFERAALCGSQGRNDHELELCRAATELTRRLLGPQDPLTLRRISYLGSCLVQPQQWAEGQKILGATLDSQERLLGARHPHTLCGKMYLGRGFAINHPAEETGIELLSESAQGLQQVLGRSHPHTITALGVLATQLQKVGNFHRAAIIHRDNLDEFSRLLGEVHPDSLSARLKLAKVYHGMGRFAESLDTLNTMRHLEGKFIDKTLSQATEPIFQSAELLRKEISVSMAEKYVMAEGTAPANRASDPRTDRLAGRNLGASSVVDEPWSEISSEISSDTSSKTPSQAEDDEDVLNHPVSRRHQPGHQPSTPPSIRLNDLLEPESSYKKPPEFILTRRQQRRAERMNAPVRSLPDMFD